MNSSSQTQQTLLWVRAETKPFEQRALITPSVSEKLLAAGFDVVVERSAQRIFDDKDYERLGCKLVEEQAWQNAPAEAIILGLKELDNALGPFTRRHVHFAHAFKNQAGWELTLEQFGRGGGTLYDLEYLTDEAGVRYAAIGYWAGFVGAACAVLAFAAQQQRQSLKTLQPWNNKEHLVTSVRDALSACTEQPTAIVIGALGRCGSGATELLRHCDLEPILWDQQETRHGGPFDEIKAVDMLINCVFIQSEIPPFTSLAHLNDPARRLSVISDVSCDPHGKYNPLPVYSQCTTMEKPVQRLIMENAQQPALDLVAIDHLPSLLPQESSEDFSHQLLPHLLGLDDLQTPVWARAKDTYEFHLARCDGSETR